MTKLLQKMLVDSEVRTADAAKEFAVSTDGFGPWAS